MDIPPELQPALEADDGDALARRLAASAAAASLRPVALQAACVLGLPSCARAAALVEGDVLLADSHTFTSLHHAARGGHAEVLGLLLERLQDGPVDVRTGDVRLSRLSYLCGGVTPLHLAAASADLPSTALLLRARADPAARDFNCWTAADHARGRAPVLELLRTSRTSLLSPQEYEAATRRRCEERAAWLEPAEFGSLLAEADAGRTEGLRGLLRSVDAKSMRIGPSGLLEAAASLGSPEGLRVIAEVLGAQGRPGHDPEAAKSAALPGLNEVGAMGFAPLHTAVETGFSECIAPLLEARADVHLRTLDASYQLGQTSTVYVEGGRTALHIAVERADARAVAELLAAGARADAVDSFGLAPRAAALEGAALLEGRAPKRRAVEEVAALLGAVHGPEAAADGLAAETVRERRAERQRRLRERVAEANAFRCAAADRELRHAVRHRYTPLDAAVASGQLDDEALGLGTTAWAEGADDLAGPPSKRSCGVAAGGPRGAGGESPMPGVFVFRLLPEDLCHRIWAESEHYLAEAAEHDLPVPTRHDGGMDLSRIFPELMQHLVAAATPAVRAFLPEELHRVSLRHAFRTKNYVGREERLVRHVDKYAVTLNVCIRKTLDVQGSGVFFYESQSSPEPMYRHEHALGLAVLHSSKEWHQTEPIAAGERGSIIMWFSH